MSWSWSDAWVLTAAYLAASNPVDLSDLVAAGDHINHAIFTVDELEHAFARLTAAGLVDVNGEIVTLSDDAIRLCQAAVDPVRQVLTATDNVDKALRQIALDELSPITIDPSSLRGATERYRKRLGV